MRFGHIDETGKRIIPAPSFYQNDDGTTTFSPSEATHNAHGNYLVANNAPETSEGYTAVFDGYALVGNVIRTAYRYEPVVPPPKVYNKYKLGVAIEDEGLLDSFLALFESNAKLKFHWNNADEFEEGDKNFDDFKKVMVASFGDEVVDRILKKAEA